MILIIHDIKVIVINYINQTHRSTISRQTVLRLAVLCPPGLVEASLLNQS